MFSNSEYNAITVFQVSHSINISESLNIKDVRIYILKHTLSGSNVKTVSVKQAWSVILSRDHHSKGS
jgi:hypothetical protein